MERQTPVLPRLVIEPREGTVSGPGGVVRLEPKVMAVLLVLAGQEGGIGLFVAAVVGFLWAVLGT